MVERLSQRGMWKTERRGWRHTGTCPALKAQAAFCFVTAHTVQSTVKIQRDDHVTTSRACVCVMIHINTATVIWKLCTRIHTRGSGVKREGEGGCHKLGFTLWGSWGQPWKKAQSVLNIIICEQLVVQVWGWQTPYSAKVWPGFKTRLIPIKHPITEMTLDCVHSWSLIILFGLT